MRPKITRFNPTTNGKIHVGHLFTALVNEAEARASGGKFYVRFDDDQEIWRLRLERPDFDNPHQGRNQEDFIADTSAVLSALGVVVDEYKQDMWMSGDIDYYFHYLNDHSQLEYVFNTRVPVMVDNSPDWVGHDVVMYPYHLHLTARKVIADFIMGVTHVIRGEDLMTEFGLYSFLCDQWRIPQPVQIYLPRLVQWDGSDISKSKGFPCVSDMREKGWTPEQIIGLLKWSCIVEWYWGFRIDNLKPQPHLPKDLDEWRLMYMAIPEGSLL